ncbi:hypothetical protein J437_LFUL008484, partial [Ladona fulva]
MDKNTTVMEIRELIQYAARQILFSVMDSPIVAGILCGIFAGVIYKIISVYVRKSINAGETSIEREDNAKENGSAFAEKNEVSEKRTSNPPENSFVKDTLDNGMEPEVTSTDKEEIDGQARDPCGDVRRLSRHPSEKDKPFFEQLQIMDLLQGNVTPEILDNEQPPIEISEWFACQNQNEGSTYDLKVTLQDKDRAAIVDFYYGYDFSKSPKGICKKVSHTFKKYGPGIRFIMFRHRIGKDVEINNGDYCCKLSDGIIQVSRNKVNTFP